MWEQTNTICSKNMSSNTSCKHRQHSGFWCVDEQYWAASKNYLWGIYHELNYFLSRLEHQLYTNVMIMSPDTRAHRRLFLHMYQPVVPFHFPQSLLLINCALLFPNVLISPISPVKCQLPVHIPLCCWAEVLPCKQPFLIPKNCPAPVPVSSLLTPKNSLCQKLHLVFL